MRPPVNNIDIDEGDADVGRVIFSILVLALLCIIGLVRGCT